MGGYGKFSTIGNLVEFMKLVVLYAHLTKNYFSLEIVTLCCLVHFFIVSASIVQPGEYLLSFPPMNLAFCILTPRIAHTNNHVPFCI